MKPCPLCGNELELPKEYLDVVKKLRIKVEDYREVIIKDFIEHDLKSFLFEIIDSHMRLAQNEYNRNPEYNKNHFSHKAEESAITFLKKHELLKEFMSMVKS